MSLNAFKEAIATTPETSASRKAFGAEVVRILGHNGTTTRGSAISNFESSSKQVTPRFLICSRLWYDRHRIDTDLDLVHNDKQAKNTILYDFSKRMLRYDNIIIVDLDQKVEPTWLFDSATCRFLCHLRLMNGIISEMDVYNKVFVNLIFGFFEMVIKKTLNDYFENVQKTNDWPTQTFNMQFFVDRRPSSF